MADEEKRALEDRIRRGVAKAVPKFVEDPEIPRLQKELSRRYLHRSIRQEIMDRGEEAVDELIAVIEAARLEWLRAEEEGDAEPRSWK